MTLSINQSMNSCATVASVFTGNEPRPALKNNEESTELTQGRGVRASAEVVERLDDERRKQNNFSSTENTDRKAQQAINAYQSLQNDQRRSEVQSLLGVDLYA